MMRLPQSDPVQNMFLLLILSLGLKLQQTEASYKKINTRYLKVSGTDEVELTCQAEGYPLAEVSWPNISIPTNTSHTKTSEGLYQVTSVLRLKPHPGRNFSCVFWNANVKELTSATIVQGPMEDPKIPPSSLLHVFIPSFIIALMFIATMVALRKRLCQKLYSGEDARKRSATMVRREVDRAMWTCGLRSWGDLIGHPQETSRLWTRILWPAELVVCTFQLSLYKPALYSGDCSMTRQHPPPCNGKSGDCPSTDLGSLPNSPWLHAHTTAL